MRNPFGRKILTDEQVDQFLREYMVDMPAQLEEEANRGLASLNRAAQGCSMTKEKSVVLDNQFSYDGFDEQTKKVIRARIDLQLERELLEEEKRQFAKVRRRSRRVKWMVGVCAMFAAVILIPMTSQSAKGFIRNMHTDIFPKEDEVMSFPEELGESTDKEDEAWAYIKEAIYAKRMYFHHLGDEWCFGEGIYDGPMRVRMTYGYFGEEVYISVTKRNGQEFKSTAISGGSCLEEQVFVGDKDSRVRMYCYESEDGIVWSGAEIVYENALYFIHSSLDYDEFQRVMKGITFEE